MPFHRTLKVHHDKRYRENCYSFTLASFACKVKPCTGHVILRYNSVIGYAEDKLHLLRLNSHKTINETRTSVKLVLTLIQAMLLTCFRKEKNKVLCEAKGLYFSSTEPKLLKMSFCDRAVCKVRLQLSPFVHSTDYIFCLITILSKTAQSSSID